MPPLPTIPFDRYDPGSPPEQAAAAFRDVLRRRRSIRQFSDRPVSADAIRAIIQTAGSAPSGANKQPWRFIAISDPALKREIRLAAEAEEREFYERRAPADWLADLEAFDTNPDKPFLETAPWLIAVFKLVKTDEGGKTYYPSESVGIAVGMLLAAAHFAGLATLTHTPSPMAFLNKILHRPDHERPFLLIPIGYPADGCTVPDLQRHPLDRILVMHEPA